MFMLPTSWFLVLVVGCTAPQGADTQTSTVSGSSATQTGTAPDSDSSAPGSTGSTVTGATGSTSSTSTSTSTSTGTSTTSTGNVCATVPQTIPAGWLDAFQTPGNGLVLFCHWDPATNAYLTLNVATATCLTHIGHSLDLFPTTLCDG